MSIQTQQEFERLREIGRIVRLALDRMAAAVTPGIRTADLDAIAESVFADNGAEAGPRKVYQFPAATCISVNEEALHGIPGDRRLSSGDLVKLDVTAEKDGYFADAAITVPVGPVSPTAARLAHCAESAFRKALPAARAGNRVSAIGRAVEREVTHFGFRVLRDYCGHGIGRSIHESPLVPNHYDPNSRTPLTPGMVLTIEPIVAISTTRGQVQPDSWTICSKDRSLTAHYEHTLVITNGEPILLTA